VQCMHLHLVGAEDGMGAIMVSGQSQLLGE
jgi:hypothetical protein